MPQGGCGQVLAEVAGGSDETFTDEEVELFIWLFDTSMDTEIEWSHFQAVILKAKGRSIPPVLACCAAAVPSSCPAREP